MQRRSFLALAALPLLNGCLGDGDVGAARLPRFEAPAPAQAPRLALCSAPAGRAASRTSAC
jgi:hypothetical protein